MSFGKELNKSHYKLFFFNKLFFNSMEVLTWMINPDFSTKILFISSDCLGRSPFQAAINLTYLKEISYFPPFGFSFISVADSLCIILHQFLFLSSSSLWTPSVFPDISSIDAYSKHIPSHAYSAVISPAVTLPSKFNIASPLDPEVAD